jgi:thiol-disulfide isomerase/thioredoxin
VPAPFYAGSKHGVQEFTSSSFDEIVGGKGSRRYLVFFYDPSNGECIRLAPLFVELASTFAQGKIRFGEVDVVKYPDLAERFEVRRELLHHQMVMFCKQSVPLFFNLIASPIARCFIWSILHMIIVYMNDFYTFAFWAILTGSLQNNPLEIGTGSNRH